MKKISDEDNEKNEKVSHSKIVEIYAEKESIQ